MNRQPFTTVLSKGSRVEFDTYHCERLHASVNVSRFQGQSGVNEYHLIVHPMEFGSIDTQLAWVSRAYQNALDSMGLSTRTAVLRRFFCSDLLNQAPSLKACPFSNPRDSNEPCAVSWAGQPPIPPAKVSLWAYHISDFNSELDRIQEGTSLTLRRGELSHHWTTGMTCLTGETSYDQVHGIFEQYDAWLRERSMSLADNAIRTWLFVDNIDANYQGLVVARREFFVQRGLTPNTHFIASSGIEGAHADAPVRVAMDAYAISCVQPEQIEFLTARDHMSPTHVYGVTFERGTSVAYRDRKHVIISGTASVDHQGRTLYPGDVLRQLDRTLENVEALLTEAGAAFRDMCVFIVYIRDPSDDAVVRQTLRERLGDVPIEVVVASVCRPEWLIEIEGQAIIPTSRPELPVF